MESVPVTVGQVPSPAETGAVAREELRGRQSAARRALEGFLREPARTQLITGKNDSRTNIIDQNRCITYAFPPDTVGALFAHLEAARREKTGAHFSERQGTPETPTSGIMLDYDIIVTDPQASLQDLQAHLIVCQVVKTLRRDLVFPLAAQQRGRTELYVFVIVKPKPVGTADQYKYGFHILIPGVRATRGVKKYLLRVLREDAEICEALADLGALGDPRECLDMNSASVPVFFLGSGKRGRPPYDLGPVFKVTFKAVYAAAAPRPDDSGFNPLVTRINPEDLEREGVNLVAETAICFEASYPGGRPPLVPAWECTSHPDIAAQVEAPAAGRAEQPGAEEDDEVIFVEHALSTLAVCDPQARYLHQILDLLDPCYAVERNRWRDVIFALANTSPSYKPLAEWFSLKCPAKWADGGRESLEQLWSDAIARRGTTATPLTIRSLIHWARLSNPERFSQVSEQHYFTILTEYVYKFGGDLQHAMIADVIHAMLGHKFIVDIEEGGREYRWYEFVVPNQPARVGEVWKWRKELNPDELNLYISKNLVKVFDQITLHIEEQRASAEDESKAKYYKKLGTAFMRSTKNLYNDSYKRSVINQAAMRFRRRGFVESLDREPLILGVGNGLLRLGPICELIDHFHEYPIMKFTPVSFRPYTSSDFWVDLMTRAIADIIPEPEVRDWILFFAASSLAGGVKEGVLLLWCGGGANGKTFFMRMVAKALGHQYAKKLNIALLTSERESADRPNSAIMQLKGCRFGYCEETQKSEPLNTQRLKEIVNPGEISGRELHKAQENFEVTANIMVGQNYNFDVKGLSDHGTWRRIKHYTSKVKFCSNPDPANRFEKKDDQRFVLEYVNNPLCQEAMLSILVYYYERLQRDYDGSIKNINCHLLEKETEAFRNSQDMINRFITECIVYSPGNGFSLSLPTVAGSYIEWFGVNIDRRRHVPSEIIQDFENSALQKYLKRAPNRTMALHDCRILTTENRMLADGESYISAGGESESPPVAPYVPCVAPCDAFSDAEFLELFAGE